MSFLHHDIIVMLIILLQKEQDDFHIRDAVVEDVEHAGIATNKIEYEECCQGEDTTTPSVKNP